MRHPIFSVVHTYKALQTTGSPGVYTTAPEGVPPGEIM